MNARKLTLAGGLTAAALAAAAAPANAAPALNGTFPLSGPPGQMTAGPGGAVWFTLTNSSTAKEFGRITPDGTVTEYDTPNNVAVKSLGAGPDVAGGPANRVWLAQENGVVKWDPAAAAGTAFPVGTLTGARDIAADRQGNLWAVASAGLVKIAPSGTKLDDVPVTGSGGRGIALGSDGRMWWADFNSASIRATSVTAPYATTNHPTGGGPQEIAAGPAGQLAFSNPQAEVGRITTAGNVLPTAAPGTDPTGVALGADGSYWFAHFLANGLGRLTPQGTLTQPIAFPAGSKPRHIVAGSGNTLWVGLEGAEKIARITGVSPSPTGGGTAGGPRPAPGGPRPAPGGSGGGGGQTADTVRPALDRLRVDSRRRRFSIRLGEAAGLRVRIEKRRRGRYRRVRSLRSNGRPGRNVLRLGRRLSRGTYRLTITAVDRAGNRSRTLRRSFRIKR